MKLTLATILTTAVMAGPLFAESHVTGDAEAGEKAFKKCKSCHMIQDAEGNNIVKGGKTGPNLYGIAGRAAAVQEGFKYGKSLIAAGEAGLVWDEEQFVSYIQDPKKFLGVYLDDKAARSKMSFKLKKGAEDVYAYLVSVGPEMAMEEAAETEAAESN